MIEVGAAIEEGFLCLQQLQIAERRLNLSRSQQLGHSATYNTPFHYLSRLQRIYPLKQWIIVIHRTGGSDWLSSRHHNSGLYDTVVATRAMSTLSGLRGRSLVTFQHGF